MVQRKLPSGAKVWKARWNEGRCGERKERNFDTKKEATEFLDEVQHRRLSGTYATPTTVAEAEVPDVPETPLMPTRQN